MENKKTWSKVWSENYSQKTEIAKFVAEHSKTSFKGDLYIPWGVMVNALMQLDEDAVIDKVKNEDGGYVHTDLFSLETVANDVKTVSTVVSHMVRVKITFMGKVFEDVYPIQDNDYTASKVYDQNKVNKALQRCMTRVISMATGLGWNLYENIDLQFDANESKMDMLKSEAPKTTKSKKKKVEVKNDLDETVVEKPQEEPQKVESSGDGVQDLVKLILDHRQTPKIIGMFDKYNALLPKKYTYKGKPLTINIKEDDEATLFEKVTCLDNPSTMVNSLRKLVG